MPYLMIVHLKVIVPLIGLHLNSVGLVLVCSMAFMIALAALCWFGRCRSSLGFVCLAAVFIGVTAMVIIVAPYVSNGFGEGAKEWLSCVWWFVLAFSFLFIHGTIADSGWNGPGGDSPDGDGRPPSSGIDWSDFDRERAGWSRPLDGALTS